MSVIGLLLVPASASASVTHILSTSFGSPGSGDGQLSLAEHSGLAVNQTTHDVYVADTANHRVVQFDPSKPANERFIRAFGADVGGPGTDVCTTGCVAGTSGNSAGAFEAPTFIAIDNSAGASKGDVYVADSAAKTVTKFDAAGNLIAGWGSGGQITGGPELFVELAGIAIDTAGNLNVLLVEPHQLLRFAEGSTFSESVEPPRGTFPGGLTVDTEGNFYKVDGSPEVTKFTPSGANLGEPDLRQDALALATDPTSGDLYVIQSEGGGFVNRYGLNCGQGCTPIESFGSGSLANPQGIALGTAETAYVSEAGASRVDVFVPGVLPDVSTEAATGVKRTTATLNGTINAAGGPQASCKFEYTTEALFQSEGFTSASSAPCTPLGPFSGSSSQAVSADIGGLSPETSYRFRIVATSENGSNRGSALGFTTLGPVNLKTGAASPLARNGATLNATIDPEGIELSECRFEFGEGGNLDQTQPCAETPAQIGNGEGAVAVHTNLTGLSESTSYSFRIAAVNSLGEGKGQVESFETLGPPTIAEKTVVQAGADTATVSGEINPHGTVTSFQVQYVSEADFNESGYAKATTVPVPAAQLGSSGFKFVPATLRVAGLVPESDYHLRFLAGNECEPIGCDSVGPDVQFRTYPSDPGIPDGRVYEMVSPAQKIGEVFVPESFGGSLGGSCGGCLPGINEITMPMQSSPDGSALAFEGQPFFAGLASTANQYLSQRSSSGWAAQSLTSTRTARADGQSGFRGFSPALSPEVPPGTNKQGSGYNDLYLWEKGAAALRPLVTVKPPHRSPGFPEEENFQLAFAGGNSGTAAVPGFEHIVFEANDALTPEVPGIAPAAPEAAASRCGGFSDSACNLYEWVGGQLRLINVLPGNNTAATDAVIGSGRRLTESLGSHGEAAIQAANVDHAISPDGSRIFWSDESGQVYLRIDGKETVKIEDPGQFLTASVDGSKVLLSDGCLYSLQDEECEAELSDTPAGFLGVMGASDDLSRIYFLSTEALAAGAQPGSCQSAAQSPPDAPTIEENEGKVPAGRGCNLYAYDRGSVTFIAALNERDNNFGLNNNYGNWKASRSNRTAQVSSDGRYLAFMSYASLTGYDSRVADGFGDTDGRCKAGFKYTVACFEVYQYDLNAKSLSCPSCNPTGKRPLGKSNLSLIRPAGVPTPFPQPENLPAGGEGRLFFESTDVLSPRELNGRIQDVFEWTPSGVGSCTRAKGCISLISSGRSPNDSFFLDATPSGSDAFFVTREQLLLRDKDDLLDVYDARVNGGINENFPPPCQGEACKGPATSASEQPSAGSASFAGPGNEKQKPKKARKHKKKHHKHKSKKTHKRSAKHNRGGQK